MNPRPVRFLLAAVVGLFAAVGMLAPAANAAPTYPPQSDGITLPSTPVAPGSAVLVSACCFEPTSEVTFTISGGGGTNSLGSSRLGAALVPAVLAPAAPAECSSDDASCVAIAEDDGEASANVTFTSAGTFTIAATGTGIDGEPLTVSSSLTVAADATGDDDGTDPGDQGGTGDEQGGPLANTGSDVITFSLIGLALLAVGAIVVIGARRRSASQPAP